MFEQVYENLNKATDSTVRMQQEMFKKWLDMWSAAPATPANWPNQIQEFQKKWGQTVEELVKQQRESTEAQFKAGLENIENAFKLAETKDIEELRKKTLELWKKSFESMRAIYEHQFKDFEKTIGKWTELMSKGAA